MLLAYFSYLLIGFKNNSLLMSTCWSWNWK